MPSILKPEVLSLLRRTPDNVPLHEQQMKITANSIYRLLKALEESPV